MQKVDLALFAVASGKRHPPSSARYVILRSTPHTSHEALGNRASGMMILENHLTEGDIIPP
jgi:hypothetical protein